MKIKNCIRIVLSAMLFAACTTDVVLNVNKIPDTKPKAVVSCFISPQDTFIRAYLGSSKVILGENSNKKISLSDLSLSIVTISDLDNGLTDTLHLTGHVSEFNVEFQADTQYLKIVAGHHYQLNIILFDKTKLTANCYVPFQNSSLVITTLDSVLADYNKRYEVKYQFRDNPGTDDYYTACAYIGYHSYYGDSEAPFDYVNNTAYFRDAQFQGKEFSMFQTYEAPGGYYSINPYMVKIIFATIDENYYKYQVSYSRQNETEGDIFSEPVIIYSNITGGLGIFAGYNTFITSKNF